MSIDFTGVTDITIPEGNVIKIENASGVLWEKPISDTTPPTITGVADGATYTANKQMYIKDENLDVVKINGSVADKSSYTTTTDGQLQYYKKFASSGTYNVIATDTYGNTTEITFVINKG